MQLEHIKTIDFLLMKKKRIVIMLFAVCAIALIAGCKTGNPRQTGNKLASGADSALAVIDSIIEENDTTPMPMFLLGCDKDKYMLMLYWSSIEEPQKTDDDDEWFERYHQEWLFQDQFRRNAAQYTNMLTDGGDVKVKFVDEVLKDPDGNIPSIGQIHGREEIPSLCARFSYANKEDIKDDYSGIIVTDSYLKSRKRLDIEYDQSEWDDAKPLPEATVRQLEERYGMKVESMRLFATIGGRYIWGKLQFEGEYKNAPKDEYDQNSKYSLALDVLIDGDKVYTNEVLGYYDENYGSTWNADDDGEYVGCSILAAFEGPKGLELCFNRSAPESLAVGMFYLRDGQLIKHTYEIYQWMIDEEIPVWKKDFAEMRKIYLEADPHSHKYVELTKWAHCYIDYTNEWLWLRDKDEKNGAIFMRDKNGNIKLVDVENANQSLSECQKDGISYLIFSGSAGGPSYQQIIYAYKEGKLQWKLFALEVYGELNECMLNNKPITVEEGKAYLDKVPEGEQITAYFNEIDRKE